MQRQSVAVLRGKLELQNSSHKKPTTPQKLHSPVVGRGQLLDDIVDLNQPFLICSSRNSILE